MSAVRSEEFKINDEMREKFKKLEIDEAGIERLRKAYPDKSIEDIYKAYDDLTTWNYNKIGLVKNVLVQLGLIDFSRPSWASREGDYIYTLMFFVIRDGKSLEEARKEIDQLSKFSNNFLLLAALSLGLKYDLIKDLDLSKLTKLGCGSFCDLSLPIKLFLAPLLVKNTISIDDWGKLATDINVNKHNLEYAIKKVAELTTPRSFGHEVKQQDRRGGALVAPESGVLDVRDHGARSESERGISSFPLVGTAFNRHQNLPEDVVTHHDQLLIVRSMAARLHIHRDGHASLTVMSSTMVARIRGHETNFGFGM